MYAQIKNGFSIAALAALLAAVVAVALPCTGMGIDCAIRRQLIAPALVLFGLWCVLLVWLAHKKVSARWMIVFGVLGVIVALGVFYGFTLLCNYLRS